MSNLTRFGASMRRPGERSVFSRAYVGRGSQRPRWKRRLGHERG